MENMKSEFKMRCLVFNNLLVFGIADFLKFLLIDDFVDCLVDDAAAVGQPLVLVVMVGR